MTIVVIGGSNSVQKKGWTARLRADHPDVVNLAVGMTPGLTGLFRLMQQPGLVPGDCVIWEYAVNDAVHAESAPVELILSHVEETLRYCAARGLRVVPLIFTPLPYETPAGRPAYFAAVQRLFRAYGLDYFDFSESYRARFGVAQVPAEAYNGENHYRHSDANMELIREGVTTGLATARVPKDPAPIHCSGAALRLLDGFGDESVANAHLSIRGKRPPFGIDIAFDAELVGLFFVAHQAPAVLRITATGPGVSKVLYGSITAIEHRLPFFLMSYPFEMLAGERVRLPAGSTINFALGTEPGRYYAQIGLVPDVAAPRLDTDAMICGVLLREDRA